MNINILKKLLDDFNKKPLIIPEKQTFLEIAGFPHYENVISNILFFFFDTIEIHGFSDLLLRTLLKCYSDEMEFENLVTNSVQREVLTNNQKRIDILIETDEIIVAIENKIFADLYNYLEEYSNYLEKYNRSNKEIFKIVLSLKKIEQSKLSNGFINITYKLLIENLEKSKEYDTNDSKTEYFIYLHDLIKTIKNLYGGNTMNQEMIEFFKENWNNIQKLQKEINKLDEIIYKKAENIKSKLEFTSNLDIKNWIYLKKCIVTDIYLDKNIIIAIDCYLDLEKTIFKIFIRNKKKIRNPEILEKILRENNSLDFEITGDKNFYLENRELINYDSRDEDFSDIIKQLTEIILNNKKKFIFV